jgi:hypothetical protein
MLVALSIYWISGAFLVEWNDLLWIVMKVVSIVKKLAFVSLIRRSVLRIGGSRFLLQDVLLWFSL